MTKPSKVLIIGSGAIVIGQAAAEVLLSGSQIYSALPLSDYLSKEPI